MAWARSVRCAVFVRTRAIEALSICFALASAACEKQVAPEDAATLALNSSIVEFEGVQAGSNPAAKTIAVMNGGSGSLTDVQIGAIGYGSGQPDGWLTVSIDRAAAPATVTLQAVTGSLVPSPADGYSAQVAIQSATAGNSPQQVSVRFRVAPRPSIAVNAGSLTYSGTTAGANPPSQSVAVTNGGGGTLSGLAVGTISYASGQSVGWITSTTLSQITAPTTLTVAVSTGSLGAGTYNASVPLTSAVTGVAPVSVAVRLVVGDGTPPTVIAVSPGNGTRGNHRSNPVTATFSEPVSPASVTTETFIVSGGTALTGTVMLSPDGRTATFMPDAPLSYGTDYVATIRAGLPGVADESGNSLAADYIWAFRANDRPTVDAGADRDVNRGAPVTLNATSADADGYVGPVIWRQVSGPLVGTLTGATPTFNAPNAIVTLEFEVTATDGFDGSVPDRVVVFVLEDAANAFWVRPGGNDNAAGTRAAPKATVQGALAAAAAAGRSGDVYLAGGTYVPNVTLTLQPGVSIYGGYHPVTFVRDGALSETIINGTTVAMRGIGASGLILDGLTIRSANAVTAGSSMAIVFRNSDNVRISNNKILAGNGGPGSSSGSGTTGAAGTDGADASGTAGAGVSGGGGNGGDGGVYFILTDVCLSDGQDGNPGSAGTGVPGGLAGPGGGRGAAGGNGGTGRTGTAGAVGLRGNNFGALDLSGYAPGNGSAGSTGGTGSAGGGGGGGGCSDADNISGGGGGEGGTGGAGGTGGPGGTGGGASFAIVIQDGSTGVTITNNVITTGNGGVGGNGRPGGSGGPGGHGGQGETSIGGNSSARNGGDGGVGGSGGDGGGGGGGGGGPVIGVVEDATSSTNLSPGGFAGNTFNLGTAGAGGTGTGTVPGPTGESGSHQEYLKL